MDDLTALRAAIITYHEEDTPRGAFADALDERNKEGDADWATFIRTQVFEPQPVPHYPGVRCSYHQHRMLDKRHGWVADLMPLLRNLGHGNPSEPNFGCYSWNEELDGTVWMELGPARITLHRGFIRDLKCPADTFRDHDRSLIWHPEQRVPCWACDGHGTVMGCAGDKENPTCGVCNGEKTTTRACPPTVHPVRTVTLTTHSGFPIGPQPDNVLAYFRTRLNCPHLQPFVPVAGNLLYTNAMWPGVDFKLLPPDPQVVAAVNRYRESVAADVTAGTTVV